jgi:hypothetical protein
VDLVSEGNIGLMLAVKRFDPGRGVHLCHVVDPCRDPGLHSAQLVVGEDRHDCRTEVALLQPAPAEEPDAGV